uniref:Secreted protein n=1 Tax=Steinernema glaseri TaxID=37863 RepID=A0A1I7XZY4_9BILA
MKFMKTGLIIVFFVTIAGAELPKNAIEAYYYWQDGDSPPALQPLNGAERALQGLAAESWSAKMGPTDVPEHFGDIHHYYDVTIFFKKHFALYDRRGYHRLQVIRGIMRKERENGYKEGASNALAGTIPVIAVLAATTAAGPVLTYLLMRKKDTRKENPEGATKKTSSEVRIQRTPSSVSQVQKPSPVRLPVLSAAEKTLHPSSTLFERPVPVEKQPLLDTRPKPSALSRERKSY